jgi:signal recognition particle subunit SRP19
VKSSALCHLTYHSHIDDFTQTEKQLLEMVGFQIQRAKPEFNIPKPPYTLAEPAPTEAPPPKSSKKKGDKGKAPAKVKRTGIPLPVPPEPTPPLTSRLSPYSPSIPSGMLIDAVKAGMTAQAQESAAAAAANPGAAKGKRKVVRVRG